MRVREQQLSLAPRAGRGSGSGAVGEGKMSKLRLTLLAAGTTTGCARSRTGVCSPEGIDLNFLDLPVEETFFRMLRNREFDVAELSLSSYTVSLFREPRPFVAIPGVSVRACSAIRASSFRRGAGYESPKDLVGKRIGTARIPVHRAGLDTRHPSGRIRRRSAKSCEY